ncbi:hypothetical protein D623_10033953 [Myotis brandtii]|uniref:Uncharacterized protein n=1 Tax=Myotis brandtii TaxID=109478 RepID=S7PCS2_MYOBR|nr:hypothetical protein D623_10033953 [Myotis brandtii]
MAVAREGKWGWCGKRHGQHMRPHTTDPETRELVYFPFFDAATASLKCLNENVLGSESTAHLAFHITLLDHVGVETG